jgi:hypothetical protein
MNGELEMNWKEAACGLMELVCRNFHGETGRTVMDFRITCVTAKLRAE